jgi:low affinity Fe/Cu permease
MNKNNNHTGKSMNLPDEVIPEKKLKIARIFDKISTYVTHKTGSPAVTVIAFLIIVIWAITGPFFHYSDTWQLVINTGTTIITFLMVFVIQQSQNKDTAALHLKLNELIAANERASNRLIDIEDLTEQELMVLKAFYIKLSEKAEKEKDLFSSHSLDEAEENQMNKSKRYQKAQKTEKSS